jgi:hypothetical protein
MCASVVAQTLSCSHLNGMPAIVLVSLYFAFVEIGCGGDLMVDLSCCMRFNCALEFSLSCGPSLFAGFMFPVIQEQHC